MSQANFRYKGRFQWWAYTVSHGQLLLRSTKSPERPTQVDILFKDVGAVCMPTAIVDPQVTEGGPQDVPGIHQLESEGRRIFLIRGSGGQGYIVAGSAFSDEGDHDFHDPSPLFPPFPPPRST